jgi:hypothetical protein
MYVCVQKTQFHLQLNMLKYAAWMCIIPIVLLQHTTTRHSVHTQYLIIVIQKATFWLHETAIAISFHCTKISEEIYIAVALHTTVKLTVEISPLRSIRVLVPISDASCKGEILTISFYCYMYSYSCISFSHFWNVMPDVGCFSAAETYSF